MMDDFTRGALTATIIFTLIQFVLFWIQDDDLKPYEDRLKPSCLVLYKQVIKEGKEWDDKYFEICERVYK